MGCGSVGLDQPQPFVDHLLAAAAGNGAPSEMINAGSGAAIGANDLTPGTPGTGEAVDVSQGHFAAPAIA
jgi:hypothetical protein